MRYQAVIFDMDGTLLNTLEDLRAALNYALERCGYPTRSLREVRAFVGNGIRRLIERGVPEGTDAAACDRVQAVFMPYYSAHCADRTRPYPGVTELLRRLRAAGVRTAVVSNKADAAVQALVRQYFDGLFDAAVGERTGVRKKPAPDMTRAALEALGCGPEQAVYVGDSEVDLETAQNAGLPPVLVSWGFRDSAFLWERGAEVIVDSAEALWEELAR